MINLKWGFVKRLTIKIKKYKKSLRKLYCTNFKMIYTELMSKKIEINGNEKVFFNNNVDFCVGTGRMGLALHKEYYGQLKLVQDEIGFKFIRGHGLFCDDMAIYQEFIDKSEIKDIPEFDSYDEYLAFIKENGKTIVEYNFTYLDRVIDDYLSLNIRPFIELGFMPKKIASGKQCVFYWKGNVTPPKDYKLWTNLVKATLSHLLERYGEEVLTWPVEVWNEPNLTSFWKDADMPEYFKLYTETSKAVKEVNENFKVGGPAICGGADEKWMKGFLDFCSQTHPPLDFITRHHYTTEFPEDVGHYGYAKLTKFDETIQTLVDCRKIINSYDEFKDLPFHITEFNTSYIPNCPLHDTNQNAAYIAGTLAEIGDLVTSYSYWTFGDVFEERGVPFTPFHGGFGLLANGGIEKPTFWTFKFFKYLKEKESECVYKDKNLVIVKTCDGEYKGVAWNLTSETKKDKLDFEIKLPLEKGRYCVYTKSVCEDTCNPLKVWHDMGEPANPSLEQIQLIKDAAKPFVKTQVLENKDKFDLTVGKHGVVYFSVEKSALTCDNGYDYERVAKGF